jgi:plasmid stabilization system protein ParE
VVLWTHRACADLQAIHDHIAKDSRRNAEAAVRKIMRRADSLEVAPRMGRVVPELREPELREISVYSWRILYRVRDDQVFIVTLVHQRRHLESR